MVVQRNGNSHFRGYKSHKYHPWTSLYDSDTIMRMTYEGDTWADHLVNYDAKRKETDRLFKK